MVHRILRVLRYLFDSVFLLLTVAVGVPVAVVATVLAVLLFVPLPASIPQPKEVAISAPTQVYDRYGNPIATFRAFDQNIPVAEKDIPTVLKEAVISVEDRNFYKHGGIDLRGSLRALVADIRSKRAVQGGSTITQQYVKLAFTGSKRTLFRKVQEAMLASQLDRQSTKDEILFRYLSIIYLGDGSYGVGAAAENYFRKPVNQLTLSEAAMIAGVIPAPSVYAPRENPDLAEAKREVVLDKMLQQGYITPQQHAVAMAQRVWLLAKGASPPSATVVYPPEQDQPRSPYPGRGRPVGPERPQGHAGATRNGNGVDRAPDRVRGRAGRRPGVRVRAVRQRQPGAGRLLPASRRQVQRPGGGQLLGPLVAGNRRRRQRTPAGFGLEAVRARHRPVQGVFAQQGVSRPAGVSHPGVPCEPH